MCVFCYSFDRLLVRASSWSYTLENTRHGHRGSMGTICRIWEPQRVCWWMLFFGPSEVPGSCRLYCRRAYMNVYGEFRYLSICVFAKEREKLKHHHPTGFPNPKTKSRHEEIRSAMEHWWSTIKPFALLQSSRDSGPVELGLIVSPPPSPTMHIYAH